jgi:hypothetical protein
MAEGHLKEPDWAALHRIARQVELLKEQGQWNREQFERFRTKAVEAAGSFTQGLEFLYNEADPDWLKPNRSA